MVIQRVNRNHLLIFKNIFIFAFLLLLITQYIPYSYLPITNNQELLDGQFDISSISNSNKSQNKKYVITSVNTIQNSQSPADKTISGTPISKKEISTQNVKSNNIPLSINPPPTLTSQGLSDPIITSPGNSTDDVAVTGDTVTWLVEDTDNNTYEIYRYGQSVPFQIGNYDNSTPIVVNVDNTTLGLYNNYTLVADDVAGNIVRDTIWVWTIETVVPKIKHTITNITINEGVDTSFIYKYDDPGLSNGEIAGEYTILINNDIYESGSWLNFNAKNEVFFNGLEAGLYNVTSIFADLYYNTIIETYWITVLDVILPILINPPASQTINGTTTGNILNYTVSEIHPNNYTFYKDGAILDFGFYNDSQSMIYNLDNLLFGVYNFKFIAEDLSGNLLLHQIVIIVTDIDFPELISRPISTTINESSVGNNLIWVAEDVNPLNYTIFINSVNVSNGVWNNFTQMIYNVDDLTNGTYDITIWISDSYFNIQIDTITLTIVDETLPEIISIPINEIPEDSVNSVLEWNATDLHPTFYEIYFQQGASPIQFGTWNSSSLITINVDGLSIGTYNYTLVVYDYYNNFVSHTLMLIVGDQIIPNITIQPLDMSISEGTTDIELTWQATDTHFYLYELYRNDSKVSSGPWVNNFDISRTIESSLTPGIYNYTIFFYDQSNNVNRSTVWITIFDDTSPIFITLPDDPSPFSLETSGNAITWIMSDSHPNNYIISINGTNEQSGNWATSQSIQIDVDTTIEGNFLYSIIIYDESGNSNTSSIIVSITSVPVFISTPQDLMYVGGETNAELIWVVSSALANQYDVFRNDTFLWGTNGWANGIAIRVNVSGLSLGVYKFTIFVNATDGATISNSVIVEVTDIPIWLSEPGNTVFDEGNGLQSISWKANDSKASIYEILQNGTSIQSNNWINNVDITLNLTNFLWGNYNITLIVYDLSGNFNFSTSIVTVLDDTNPVLGEPLDYTYNENVRGNVIEWNPIDNYPSNYSIYRDGELQVAGIWISGMNITINVDYLLKGIYNYTIIIEDQSGNQDSHSLDVEVIDLNNPEPVVLPNDITFSEGSTSNQVNWTFNDPYNKDYTIYIDENPVKSGSWDNSNTIFLNGADLDDLLKGSYSLKIIVTDDSNNEYINIITIFVIDTTAPEFSADLTLPNDLNYTEDMGGNFLVWNTTDNYSDTYEVYINSELSIARSGDWNNSFVITVNIDGLAKGNWTLVIYIFDLDRNNISDTVLIEVFDKKTPLFNLEPDVHVEMNEESSNNNLIWNLSEKYPDRYEVFVNGTSKLINTWLDSTNITFSIDYLLKGNYTITVYFYDLSGNNISDTVTIEVFDNILPSVSFATPDFVYVEDEIGNIITWVAVDNYPNNYVIERNGLEIETGFWNSSQAITISGTLVDGLPFGEYDFIITLYDKSNNSFSYKVLVTVADLPNISSASPDDNFDEEFITSYLLIWNVTDQFPSTYSIDVNGNIIVVGNWTNDVEITLFVNQSEFLVKGVYVFTLTAFDETGNNSTRSITITIDDNKLPLLTENADVVFVEDTIGNNVSWIATDLYPSYYEIWIDSNFIISMNWGSSQQVDYNLDDLIEGVYNLEIIFYDESGNSENDIISITVNDETNPIFICDCNQLFMDEGTTDNFIIWSAFDKHPGNFEIFSNSSSISIASWNSNVTNNLRIDQFKRGIYIIRIVITDASGNQNETSFILIVSDIDDPSLTSNPIGFNYPEESTGHTITWTASDTHPDRYELYDNGTFFFGNPWFSEIPALVPMDGLLKGTHNFTLFIYDDSENFRFYSFTITVYDDIPPVINVSPQNATLIEDMTAMELIWNVEETYPSHYNLYINGILEDENQLWSSNVNITYVILDLETGEYNFTMELYDLSKHIVINTFFLTVYDQTASKIISQPSNNTVYLLDGTTGRFLIWEVEDRHPDTYILLQNGVRVASTIWTNDFSISYNIDSLSAGTYNFTLTIFDESQNEITQTIILRMKDPDIVDTITPSVLYTTSVREGDVETLTTIWVDENGTGVPNADIVISLFQGDTLLVDRSYSIISAGDGIFVLVFNYTSLLPGDYVWKIQYNAKFYEGKFIEYPVTIEPHEYDIIIGFLGTLTQGEPFGIIVSINYKNRNNQTLDLSSVSQLSGPANGVVVELTFSFVDLDGATQSLTRDTTSNSEGNAKFIIEASITSTIEEITFIGAAIGFDTEVITEVTEQVELDDYPEIEREVQSLFENIISFILNKIIFLFLALAAVILFLYFSSKVFKENTSEARAIFDQINNAKEELSAIQSIQAIIIQTNSGIPLYENTLKSLDIDSILISGMSSAISSFLNELDKEELFGFETMIRQNVSITTHKQENSMLIILSGKPLPLILLDQIKKSHIKIEDEFSNDFTQGQRGFEELDKQLVGDIFVSNGLKINLTNQLQIEKSKINKVKNIKSLSRMLKQKTMLVHDFVEEYESTGNTFKLKDIFKFFRGLNIDVETGSRIILTLYTQKILTSSRE